jgi:signal transduction histidine kinase
MKKKQLVVGSLFYLLVVLIHGTSGAVPADSLHIKHLHDQAYQLEKSNPDSALQLYHLALNLSKQFQYNLGIARSLFYQGIVHADHGHLDSARYYYRQSLNFFEKAGNQRGLGSVWNNLGNLSQFQGLYKQATEEYLQGISYFEMLQDTSTLVISYNNLGTVFSFQSLPQKADLYYSRAQELAIAARDTFGLADTYINFSKINIQQKDTLSALNQIRQLLALFKNKPENYYRMLAYNNLAEVYNRPSSLDSSLYYATRAVEEAREYNQPYFTAGALISLAIARIGLRQYREAIGNLNEAGEIGESLRSLEYKSHVNLLLAQAYEGMQDYPQALKALNRHRIFADTLFDVQQAKSLSELETRYQTEKKDRELAQQTLLLIQNQETLASQRRIISYSLLVLLIFTGGLVFSLVYVRQRKKLHLQEIIGIQRENELKAIKAMISGEEKERTRIAKELHDGLSGMMGAIKLRLGGFMNYLQQEPQQHQYQEALGMIDHAAREIRTISHNLMPEILLKFGLAEALQNHFQNINLSGTLEIDFQHYGLEQPLDKSLELTLYRIVQELINNIIKHSRATEALVQINRSATLLTLTVEDNGTGFQPGTRNGGAGLDSIKSRVDVLNGKFDIRAEEEAGTSVYIELVLDKTKPK